MILSQQSVDLFKKFVKNHPKLIKEVRNGKRNWQELYEEWYILGDHDPVWDVYKEEVESGADSKSEWFPEFLTKVRNVDLKTVQKNISEVKGLVTNIQALVREFQPSRKPPTTTYHYPYYYQQKR